MTASRSRFLTSSTNSSSPQTSGDPSPSIQAFDSDFVVILAALLCALICVLGLVAVARCSWFRRMWYGRSSSSSEQPPPAPNKGVKKKVLKSLPKTTYGGEKEDEDNNCKVSMECAICLSEFEIGEELRVLPQCGHRFHVECVDRWLRSHSSCPSCRQILVSSASTCHKCGGGFPEGGGGGDRRSHEVRESSNDNNNNNVFLP